MMSTEINTSGRVGIDWLGAFPEHWKAKRIKDVFGEFGSGTTPQASNPRYYENGDIPWLNTSDLNNGVVLDTSVKITKEALEETSLKLYPKGSFAIAMYGQGKTRGTVGLIDFPFTTNQASCVMFKPKRLNLRYLLLWFNYKYESIRAINVGASQPNMNQDFVRFLQIHYPPLEEQTAIAEYLDTQTQAIDKKVILLEKKISYYQELRKSLINETVTNGLDKNVKLKDSGIDWIGRIPEHWEVKRVKDIFATLAGGTPSTKNQEYWIGTIPWIPSGKVQNNDVLTESVEEYISDLALKESSTKIAKRDSVLIALTGATCSNIGYLTFDTTINQSIVALFPLRESQTSSRFFFYFLIAAKEKIRTYMTGGAQGGINQEDVRFLEIVNLPKSEQKEIVKFLDAKLDTIAKIITNIQTQITTLKELRKTLINDVVTGKIKVIQD